MNIIMKGSGGWEAYAAGGIFDDEDERATFRD